MKRAIKIFSVIFFFTFIALGTSLQAQSHYRRSLYGDFFGGITFASMDIKGGNEYKKNKIGFMVGGNANFRFYHNMVLQSGFHIVKKGLLKHKDISIQQDGPIEKFDVKETVDANYIQIPLNLGFEVPIAKNFLVNFNAGVFGAFGFKGESKTRGYSVMIINGEYQNQVSQDKPTVKTFSNQKLKKWDYGVGFNVGVVHDVYILRFQYDHGLANVATDALGTEWHSRNYMVCLGFRF